MRAFQLVVTFVICIVFFVQPCQSQDFRSVEASDGAKIVYRVIGRGPPILFIHGFLGNMDYWFELTAPLINDFTMVMMDLRGHGRSTNPVPEYNHEQFAHDAAAVMEAEEFERYGVVAHSAGGIAAYHLSSIYPDRVGWQIVMGSSPVLGPEQRDRLGNFPEFDDMEQWLKDVMLGAHPRGREQIDHLLHGFRDYGLERNDVNFDAQKLSTIETPTLVIWGDREKYPVETAVELYNDLPNAWLWVVPGVGHQIFWPKIGGSQLAAEEFVDRMRAFSAEHH